MMRHVVLGAVVGFFLAVVLLSVFERRSNPPAASPQLETNARPVAPAAIDAGADLREPTPTLAAWPQPDSGSPAMPAADAGAFLAPPRLQLNPHLRLPREPR